MPETSSNSDSRASRYSDGNRIEILVVDDEARIREMLQLFLDSQGYQTHTAAGGEVALTLARRHKPALIIADLMMPGMTGIGLIRELKSDAELQDILILAMTGGSLQNADEAEAAGADGFIAKPFRTAAILEEIKFLLASKQPGQG